MNRVQTSQRSRSYGAPHDKISVPNSSARHAQRSPNWWYERKHGRKISRIACVPTSDAGQWRRHLNEDNTHAEGKKTTHQIPFESTHHLILLRFRDGAQLAVAGTRTTIVTRGTKHAVCRPFSSNNHETRAKAEYCIVLICLCVCGTFCCSVFAHLHPRIPFAVFPASLAGRIGVPEVYGQRHLCSDTGRPFSPAISLGHVDPKAEIDDMLPRHRGWQLDVDWLPLERFHPDLPARWKRRADVEFVPCLLQQPR